MAGFTRAHLRRVRSMRRVLYAERNLVAPRELAGSVRERPGRYVGKTSREMD